MATEITAKGDLIVGTGSATFDNLAAGTNGQTLVADSTASTGLKWASASSGAVVQVKSATYSTATSNTSTTFADTGLSLSITPTSASNKILIIISQHFYMNRLNEEIGSSFRILRDGSNIITDNYAYYQYVNSFSTATDWGWMSRYNLTFLDSPATTSAVTYKTQFSVPTALSGSSALVTTQEGGKVSTITLMEVTP
jgi:hypothetical protein